MAHPNRTTIGGISTRCWPLRRRPPAKRGSGMIPAIMTLSGCFTNEVEEPKPLTVSATECETALGAQSSVQDCIPTDDPSDGDWSGDICLVVKMRLFGKEYVGTCLGDIHAEIESNGSWAADGSCEFTGEHPNDLAEVAQGQQYGSAEGTTEPGGQFFGSFELLTPLGELAWPLYATRCLTYIAGAVQGSESLSYKTLPIDVAWNGLFLLRDFNTPLPESIRPQIDAFNSLEQP